MTPEEKRIAIAEACGWKILQNADCSKNVACYAKDRQGELRVGIPDYLGDLNAMHEAEKLLMDDVKLKRNYLEWLGWEDDYMASAISICHASAAQRAEAFGRALNLWTE